MLGARRAAVPNRVLASLRDRDYRRLFHALETVDLSFGRVLSQPGDRIEYVYFPNNCLISLIAAAGEGQVTEVGLVGNEGVVGGSIALGIGISPFRAIVQGAGSAARIKAAHLNGKFSEMVSLQREVLKFSHLLTAQVAQTAVCNRYHVVSERLARWLLMTRDRLYTNEFRLTQEFLAYMLGVRRAGVSRAASVLKKRKIIRYSRGKLTILDAKALAATSCRCYRQVKELYEHS